METKILQKNAPNVKLFAIWCFSDEWGEVFGFQQRATTLSAFLVLICLRYFVMAAACDGTRITTTFNEQEAVPRTLPTF